MYTYVPIHIYARYITHKCIYNSFSSLSLSVSFSVSPLSLSQALALSLSCSLALSFSFSFALSLTFRSRSHLSRTHTHTCCSHTSCLFRRLSFHSLSLTLGLNQVMIPKQGESTCDACCFGFGGVSLESCMGNTLVSPHCFESNPHYQERQFPIVMSSMFICQSSLCLIQRVAACRSVSHRVALCRSMLHCSGHSYVGSSWI